MTDATVKKAVVIFGRERKLCSYLSGKNDENNKRQETYKWSNGVEQIVQSFCVAQSSLSEQ